VNLIEKLKKVPWLFTLLSLTVISLLVWGLFFSGEPEMAAPEAPQVTTAKPVVKDITTYEYFTGTAASIGSVEIRTRVEGFLETVDFEPSTDVDEGKLLFTVEPVKYQAGRDEAFAKLNASIAEKEKAQSELERVEQAIKAQAVSEQEVTSKRAQRDKAVAAVKAAQAILVEAELELSYTKIHTPIQGKASRNLIDVGNLVGSGEDTLLTTVVKMDPIRIYFNVSEFILLERLSKHAKGGKDVQQEHYKFSIGLSNEEGHPRQGELDYIDNVVDPSTGTISVRGVVDNKDEVIVPGMFVRVRLTAGKKDDAILVEEVALGTDIGGKYLMIVGDDNIVEQRQIEIGALIDNMRVVEKGISAEEVYIVNGLLRARPGKAVTPKTQKAQEQKGQKQEDQKEIKTNYDPDTGSEKGKNIKLLNVEFIMASAWR
jgi:multidrug efflux system membrane fusion protein